MIYILSFLWSPWFFLGLLTLLIYKNLWRGMDYFEKRGIPHEKTVPIFGNAWNLWKRDLLEEDVKKLKKFGTVWGEINGLTKTWVIADPELIKKIFVKEFECFAGRMNFFTGSNKYVERFLSVVSGPAWRDIRNAVSPGFSSGKIKNMSYLMEECTDALQESFLIGSKSDSVMIKRLYASYTLDIVASCAFGTKIDSLKSPDNEFVSHIKNMFKDLIESPLMVLPFFMGEKIKKLLPSTLDMKAMNFFTDVVKAILQSRRSDPSNRNDFLDVLLETKKSNAKHKEVLDEVTITSQAILFFLVGFETTGATMTYLTYSLTTNPEVQEKLYQEILKAKKENGKLDHDSIHQLKYLEACINESLRLYSIGGRLERQVTKTVTIDGYTFEEGTSVMVPAYAMHHDDKYFEEPYAYKPERFLTMDKEILNSVWMPFGIGPRNCIGMRFAYEEIKFGICSLLLKFKFSKSENTPDQLQFKKGIFANMLDEIEVKVEPRLPEATLSHERLF